MHYGNIHHQIAVCLTPLWQSIGEQNAAPVPVLVWYSNGIHQYPIKQRLQALWRCSLAGTTGILATRLPHFIS